MEWQQLSNMCHKMSASAEGLNGNEEAEGGPQRKTERLFPLLFVCVLLRTAPCAQIIKSIFWGENSINRSDLSSPLYQMAAVHFIC